MEKQRYERPVIRKINSGLMNKFGTRTEFQPLKTIDNIPVVSLIGEFGSPLFILSETRIRKNIRNAVRIFSTRYPKVQFAWSYKTNYLGAVCNIFHQEGSWAEVVSGFEYRKALAGGVPGDKIIFNGPGKTDDDLLVAAGNNSLTHIDNLDELFSLSRICGNNGLKAGVAIRVNMDTGVYPKWDRFGFNYENGQAWNAITRVMNDERMVLRGLHCHIGTYMLSPSAYSQAASKMSRLAIDLKNRYGRSVEYIDLGGGFPSLNSLKGAYLPGTDTIPSIDQFADSITEAILSAGFRQDELPLLILETGRALIDDAGYLAGTVLATKRLPDGRRATILDLGVNTLFTSFWYDHKISPVQDSGEHTEDTVLFGPLCMNIDVIRESVNLPLLQKGNNVVVHRVGAYNLTQWMQFISLRPNVVLIDEKSRPHIIRKAEDPQYIEMYEQIPAHLKNNGI